VNRLELDSLIYGTMKENKETKSEFVIVRVTPTEKIELTKESGGKRKLSKYLRARLGLK